MNINRFVRRHTPVAKSAMRKQGDPLKLLIIETDERYAQHLKHTIADAYACNPDVITHYALAYNHLQHYAKTYDLVIIGTPIADSDVFATLADFNRLDIDAWLILSPALEHKAVHWVHTRLNGIVDCAEKTYDKRMIRKTLEAMLTLIRNKRYNVENPLAFL